MLTYISPTAVPRCWQFQMGLTVSPRIPLLCRNSAGNFISFAHNAKREVIHGNINSGFNSQAKHLPKAGTNVDWLCPILVVIWFVRTTYNGNRSKQTKFPEKQHTSGREATDL